jgi:hypothetical protein
MKIGYEVLKGVSVHGPKGAVRPPSGSVGECLRRPSSWLRVVCQSLSCLSVLSETICTPDGLASGT